MKKLIISIISIISVLCMLCACSNGGSQSNANLNQTVNPIRECTVDDIKAGLGLKGIDLDGIDSTCIIEGEQTIFSIELTQDDICYNIRIAKANNEDEIDISGVYLSDKAEMAVFDSADIAIAPSFDVSADEECDVAYCNWNGYNFSVSTNKKISLDDMYKVSSDFVKALISKENIN